MDVKKCAVFHCLYIVNCTLKKTLHLILEND